jgi:hypothetical protein
VSHRKMPASLGIRPSTTVPIAVVDPKSDPDLIAPAVA